MYLTAQLRPFRPASAILLIFLLAMESICSVSFGQADNANPPEQIVKLIFIHHSTGENWLRDDYGKLGQALGNNNYFVSDTNYGWGPNAIGDRTDIPDWLEWFRSADTPTYMQALYAEHEQHSSYTRTLNNPGGPNKIVMFKSCFPNSNLEGNPNDAPNPTPGYTVGHAKYVYNQLLKYFDAHNDKLFIVVTAPPLRLAETSLQAAANARAFNNWLVYNWLWENNYTKSNVAVFDFYNVLTGANHHHYYFNGNVTHVFDSRNTAYYPTEDSHPSAVGSRKASNEFVPLLNVYYHRWKAGAKNIALASQPAYDGWILESSENAGTGGTINQFGNLLKIGDDAGDRQYRSLISFGTTSLPDNAEIVSAMIKLKTSGVTGNDPFTTLGALNADIRKGAFSSNLNLQAGDFQATANKLSVATFNKIPVNRWYNAVMKSADFPRINLSGAAQFRLRFNQDDNDNQAANYRDFYSGNANLGNRPSFWLTYYEPSMLK